MDVPLKVGDPVCRGDIIETSADGRVGIRFIDGTVFSVSNSARMVLKEFVCEGTSPSALLDITSGTFAFFGGEMAKAGALAIDTPHASIRGRSRSGGIGMLSIAALFFAVMEEAHATSDDGHLDYGAIPYAGFFELTTHGRNPKQIVVVIPEQTVVLHRGFSEVEYIHNSPAQMAQLQAAQQFTLHTFSLALQQGPTITAPSGSTTPPNIEFAPPAVQPINYSHPDNGPSSPQENFVPTFENLTNGGNDQTTKSNDQTTKSLTAPPTLDVIYVPPPPNPPSAPMISTTVPTTYNGSSIDIAGTAEPSSTVTLYNNGSAPLGSTTADGSGNWHVNGIQLSSGTNYSFTAIATDAAGTSTSSTALVFQDIQPVPGAPTLTIGANAVSGNEDGAVALNISETPSNPSDTVIVTITGIPSDATLTDQNNDTLTISGGSITLTPAELAGLTLHAGESSATLQVTATNTAGATASSPTQDITLTVNPVAENPVFSGVTTTSANEDGQVTLGASVAPHDSDDGAISVMITGLSGDLSGFNGGTYTAGSGTWTGTAAQFNALTFNAGEDGVQNLTVTATTSGPEAGTTQESYTLTVNPVAEGPVLGGATSATANAGGLVTLGVTEAAFDADDTLGTVTITGLPSDLSGFNGGTYTAGTGTWTGTAVQFNALTFNAGTTSATLSISATNTATGEAGTTQESYTLTVNSVEGPVLGGASSATVNEDGLVTLGVTDTAFDGNSTLGTVTITGLPSDLSGFNGGSYDSGSGTWSGTAAQFNALAFDAGETSATLTISATSTTAGQTATTQESYALTVNPVAENPVFSGVTTTSANEDGQVTLGASVAPHDSDDGAISVMITGLSGDLSGFNGGTYDSRHRDVDGDGGAVQRADLQCRRGRRAEPDGHRDDERAGSGHDAGELHAHGQSGCGGTGSGRGDLGDGECRRTGHAGRDGGGV